MGDAGTVPRNERLGKCRATKEIMDIFAMPSGASSEIQTRQDA
jgi:hypothetical protein